MPTTTVLELLRLVNSTVKMKFAAILIALAGSAAAFAPVAQPKVREFCRT